MCLCLCVYVDLCFCMCVCVCVYACLYVCLCGWVCGEGVTTVSNFFFSAFCNIQVLGTFCPSSGKMPFFRNWDYKNVLTRFWTSTISGKWVLMIFLLFACLASAISRHNLLCNGFIFIYYFFKYVHVRSLPISNFHVIPDFMFK